MGQQVGSYAGTDLRWFIEHDSLVNHLTELQDVSLEVDRSGKPGGAGLGDPRNRYHKTGIAAGTWKISRNALKFDDKGLLFLDLLAGAAKVHNEPIAVSAVSYTLTLTPVCVFEVRYAVSKLVLLEGLDYVVDYANKIVYFLMTGGLPAAAEVLYGSTSYKAESMILNSGFEVGITGIWSAQGPTGVPTRVTSTTTAPYLGSYCLQVATAVANDGCKHDPNITVHGGLAYICRFAIKGTIAAAFTASWTDAGGNVAMTPVSPAVFALAAGNTWEIFTATFTPDENTILDIRIVKTTASATTFWLDDIYLGLSTPTKDAMDGNASPFEFNIVGRRRSDLAVVRKARGCAVYTAGFASGGVGEDPYKEEVGGQFLYLEQENDVLTYG